MSVFLHIDKCVTVWRSRRRLDGGVLAVFNKGEMCVFLWGDGGLCCSTEKERKRDGAEIEH